jgi:hypothetical protein
VKAQPRRAAALKQKRPWLYPSLEKPEVIGD